MKTVNQIFCRFVFVISLISGQLASANFVGNDTQNFNPLPSGLDFVTVHGSQTLGVGIFNSGFFVNYAKDALPPSYNAQGQKVLAKDAVSFGDISIGYGAFNKFDLGLSFSYLLSQQTDLSIPGARFGSTGLNEIRVLGKYNFIQQNPLGISGIMSINLNQTRNNPFAGVDAGPTVNLEITGDYKFNHILFAANAGYRLRNSGRPADNALYQPLPNQIIASLAASYYYTAVDLKLIGEIFAAKSTQSILHVDAARVAAEFLVGIKYDASPTFALHFGTGSRIAEGLFTPDWRTYLGLNATFDLLEKPVATAAAAPAPVVITNTQVRQMGFMPEDIIALAKTPFDEIASKHEFNLRTTVPDKDFEGDKPPFEIIRLDGLDFDFGSSSIRQDLHPMLNRLAAYLETKPPVIKVRIEGHTDSLGSPERNKSRSQSRAEAVRDFLQNSLKNKEVHATGYGSDRPIADNGNFQGRKQNRRVEVRILREISPPPESVK